jgi:formamidopyrimidine-DNA glycosylase
MPELPEVQTVADELRPQLLGRTFTGLEADWAPTLATAPLPGFRARLVGQHVLGVRRRGKYLVFPLCDSDTLLVHLMMSGRLSVVPTSAPCEPYVHTRFLLDDGRELRFRDVRKLGRVYLVSDPDDILGHLGPEPLEESFTLERFRELVTRRHGKLKPLLLNQQFLAGLGNIYADETLFVARLHPLRRADTLSGEEVGRLYEAVRHVLSQAVANRGTTLDDAGYRRPNGQAGNHQHRLQVYGQTGRPCSLCGTPIQRIVVSGRGTHFCSHCQTQPSTTC